MADPVGALVGRPAPTPRGWAATTGQCPLAARVGLQVEWAELVDADHHIRVTLQHISSAIHQPI
jgi:hypothetical protein